MAPTRCPFCLDADARGLAAFTPSRVADQTASAIHPRRRRGHVPAQPAPAHREPVWTERAAEAITLAPQCRAARDYPATTHTFHHGCISTSSTRAAIFFFYLVFSSNVY